MQFNRYIFFSVLFSGLVFFSLSACEKENEESLDCDSSTPGYAADIKPIINANCVSSGCHNSGSANGDFTTYDGLRAFASSGALKSRVVENKNMPPTQPLSFEERKKINCWVNSGSSNN